VRGEVGFVVPWLPRWMVLKCGGRGRMCKGGGSRLASDGISVKGESGVDERLHFRFGSSAASLVKRSLKLTA